MRLIGETRGSGKLAEAELPALGGEDQEALEAQDPVQHLWAEAERRDAAAPQLPIAEAEPAGKRRHAHVALPS